MSSENIGTRQEIASDGETAVTAGTKAKFKKIANYLLFGNFIRLKNRTAYAGYIASMSALAVVLSFSVGIGGGEVIKFTLSYTPLFLAGIYFGPLTAAAVGVISQITGSFLYRGYMPWATNIVCAALMGVLMCFCVQLFRRPSFNARIIIGAAAVCVVVTLGLNTLAFTYEPFSPYEGWTYWQILFFTAPPRVIVQPLVLAFNAALTVMTARVLNVYFKTKGN